MYSYVLCFGEPPVTWQLCVDANVKDLLVRDCPQKKKYHMVMMVQCAVSLGTHTTAATFYTHFHSNHVMC